MLKPLSSLVGLALIAASVGAHAATFEVLGKTLQLSPPPEFCELGQSPREQALLEFQQKSMSLMGELAQMVVPCNELDAFISGEVDAFTRWAQVVVAKSKDRVQLVTVSRKAFIRNTAGAANTPVDMAEVQRRVDDHLADTGVTMRAAGMRPLGTTAQAFFTELRMTAQAEGQTVPLIAIVAVTTAKQLPLMLQIYGTPKATGAPLMETATAYVAQVLSAN